MEFASEMVIKATLGGLSMSELPITLHKDGRSRPPHLRSWRDGWRHLRFMLLLSPRWVFLGPGLLLMAVGILLGSVLAVRPIEIGSIRLDTNTLLVCTLAVIVGLQVVLYAASAELLAVNAGLVKEGRRSRARDLFQLFTLERGIAVALLLLAVGGAFLVQALLWKTTGFGALSYPDSLRLVIPAVTTLAAGTQVLFASFFLSALALLRKDAS